MSPESDGLKAAIVPGIAGQFEGLVTTPDECIFRIQAARNWFSTAELLEFEQLVRQISDRKRRPALSLVR